MLFLALGAGKVLCKVLATHGSIHGPLRMLQLLASSLVFKDDPVTDRRIDRRMRPVERA